MRAVEQWQQIESEVPQGWEEVRLSFVVEDEGALPDAAAVLAPLGPGRSRDALRFHVRRTGSNGPEAVRNLLRRLDRKRIWGALTLVDARVPAASEEPTSLPSVPPVRSRLVEAWEAALEALPPDWSDLLCELEVDSSDYLPRAALLGAPLNPTRNPDRLALRFRVSGKQGYGASAGMVRRCLERMDAEGITGTLTVLHALSETENVGTQGPVWRVAGRSV
jgi:hypothetical protein